MMLFSLDRQLVTQSLQANVKPFSWRAHDGVILQVDWNVINNQLISASEDCKYKVWDSYGRLLYSSAPFEYPVTSISWSPDGQLFAVGSYATVVLCDKLGWIHALEETQTGSILSIKWSPDGNQIACAGGNGRIINGYVIERCLEWNGFEALLADERTVVLQNLRDESVERLEFRDRVSKASFSFNYFIVVTSTQCYVYKYFALADGSSVYVYNYDVRLICSLKHANIHAEQICADSITMSNDVIGIKDQLDKKIIHLFDPSSGKTLGDGKPITHSNEIMKISLNQMGNSFDRRLALLDSNKDLYLMSIRILGNQRKMIKLATMVSSFLWAETSNILAAITNDKLVIWFYPDIALTNSDIINLTQEEHNIIELLRKCESNGQERILWACLAGLATNAKMLDVAEIAFAEIEEVDKVEYIRYIKSLPTTEMRNAEILLLSGEYQEAEAILLQNHLYFRAIMLNLHAFKWNRALELANKYNLAVDIVLSMRHDYLKQLNRVEELHSFNTQPKQSTLDASELKERIEEEYLDEKKQLQELSTT
ncbi:putative wd40 repeat-containing [Schistosoma mansoni]|uniref:putative wd40 repeat-containing n=1 Tax=Schistosoma mansoni TaxID=6183 RepID=UPI0001A64292|nr:putative wd40 repeat-containing [Schistosoma mansoni]|eukprot:XP_018650441.1 putative wd40 repeat-containing [Schistosoma mansoni]